MRKGTQWQWDVECAPPGTLAKLANTPPLTSSWSMTSRCWSAEFSWCPCHKQVHFNNPPPIFPLDTQQLNHKIRKCLLCQVAVPGWDSQNGPAVHFRLSAKNTWIGSRKLDPWQLAPIEEPDDEKVSVQEQFKKKQFQLSPNETWVEHPELMSRKKKPEPEAWTHRGEAPWTNVDPHGSECNSSAAHILGFALNYASVPQFNRGTNEKKKMTGFVDWYETLEPPMGRPPPGGTWECLQPRNRPTKDIPESGSASSCA